MIGGLLAVFVVLLIGFAYVAVGAQQSRRRRWTMVSGVTVLLVLGTGLISEFLSRPKPIFYEWRGGEATVEHYVFAEGEAIYLWLRWPDNPTPFAYEMAWSENAAKSLQEATEEAEEEGGTVMADLSGTTAGEEEMEMTEEGLPLESSLEDRDAITFHAVPQPALPPKELPKAAQTFNLDRPDS